MKHSKHFWRGLFFIFLITALCSGLALPAGNTPARAAPQLQAVAVFGDIVISEFRTRGVSANDEFVELYNRTNATFDIGGWTIRKSSGCGTSITTLLTLPTGTLLNPGQHYLAAGLAYTGLVTPNLRDTGNWSIADDGGIAVLDNSSTPKIINQVGMCATTAYRNGTSLTPMSGTSDQSYERRLGGASGSCQDTVDNSSDFQLITPSNPENSSSPSFPCTGIAITNVTSSVPDATYIANDVIDITITFNGQVNVAGSPTLLLETGVTDRPAAYVSGSGTNALLFNYTVTTGDSSSDLDYVATNSLSGGTITGVTGAAILTLPSPGSPGSLGANKAIVIDNGIPPSVVSFTRQTPSSQSTNADSLVFHVTFNESVVNVDGNDFVTTGTTATPTSVTPVSTDVYDVTISGGDLSTFNGTVGLNLSASPSVNDLAGNSLQTTEPSTDQTYTLDNIAPNIVSFTRQSPTSTTTNADTLTFRVTFGEAVMNVDNNDFVAAGTTGTLAVTTVSNSVYDVTISGGDLPNLNGTVGLNLSPTPTITDLASNPLPAGEPSVDEIYTVNNTALLTHLVISEFRTTGPNGADDEFIEIYNPTSNPVDISGWIISGSNSSGTVQNRATIPVSTLLRSGQYYLVAHNSYNNSSVPPNLRYGTGITNDGGIALLNLNGQAVDEVGLHGGSVYQEGTVLLPLTNSSQSYERKAGGTSDSCVDTDNNNSDFSIPSSITLHNYSSPLSLCGISQPTPSATTTTITADTPDPSLVNENVTVSVSVTGGSTTATGKVNISGTNASCSIPSLSAAGTGSCILKFTSTGSKTITAIYLGDNTHQSSTSVAVSHQVNTAPSVGFTPIPTPRPTLGPPPPLIGINEFVPRPGHDWNNDGVINVGDEYIELINHGVIDVNLSSYTLDDEVNIGSNPYTLPSITLKPGERHVFYGSETGLLLSDGGDGVRLLRVGQLEDAYNYSVVRFPDQSFCRLPDNGGLDDWNQNCFPTPGLQNSLSGSTVNPPTSGGAENLCPISDTLPLDFVLAECPAFGNNIWNSAYWDRFGWFNEQYLPESFGKWPVFVD